MAEVSDILFASPKWWAILTVYLLILKPTSLLLALFTRQWRELGMNSTSLQNAGQWIGYLERCLILTFILVGFNEAIGFLLAAKSIFRFGELSKGQEIKTTEYVLIGTLASFTIAILRDLYYVHFFLHTHEFSFQIKQRSFRSTEKVGFNTLKRLVS